MTGVDPPEFRMDGGLSKQGRQAVMSLVETESADCVIVLHTKYVRGATVAIMNHFGNDFIVRGLIEACAEAVLGWDEGDEEDG